MYLLHFVKNKVQDLFFSTDSFREMLQLNDHCTFCSCVEVSCLVNKFNNQLLICSGVSCLSQRCVAGSAYYCVFSFGLRLAD